MQKSYYSCLVFLFTGIWNQILAPSRASGNTWFMTCLQSAHVKVKKNVMSRKLFLRFYYNK